MTIFGTLVEMRLVGGVCFCLLVRILARMRAGGLRVRFIVPRTRVRTVASACAVSDGLQNDGSRSNEKTG